MVDMLIEYIGKNLFILILIILMVSYYAYSIIRENMALKKVEQKKKGLEDELDKLEEKYGKKIRELEEQRQKAKKLMGEAPDKWEKSTK